MCITGENLPINMTFSSAMESIQVEQEMLATNYKKKVFKNHSSLLS